MKKIVWVSNNITYQVRHEKTIPYEKFYISGNKLIANFPTKFTTFTAQDLSHISEKFYCNN